MALEKIGKYRLLELVATGGMAELWLARQEGPAGFARTVAVKRVLPHLASDERFVEMFLDEARIAALLTHPNIVHIHDFGEEAGEYFLSMEFVRGRSLDDVLERAEQQRLPLTLAAYIVGQACVGLDYAHNLRHPETGQALELVHRDVSPQNVMVSFDGLVKVMDFGIAKAVTSQVHTQTGTVKGKYAYMSPEQIAGDDLDQRSDVFALGILLYEVVTGVRPFGERSDLVAITAILNEPPRPLRDMVPDVPPELETIIHKALEKDRADRYDSAGAMYADLERFVRSLGEVVAGAQVAALMRRLYGDVVDAPSRPSEAATREERSLSQDDGASPLVETTLDAVPTFETTQRDLSDTDATGPPQPPAHSAAPDRPPRSGTGAEAETAPAPGAAAVSASASVPASTPAPASETKTETASETGTASSGFGVLLGGLVVLGLVGAVVAWTVLGARSRGPVPAAPVAVAPAGDPLAAERATIEAGLLARLGPTEGLLTVQARPGTAVFLDGETLGSAPIAPRAVEVGTHVVRALLLDGTPWEGRVAVEARRKATVKVP